MSSNRKVRLPSWFKPTRYALTLQPDLEKATFTGEETITYRLMKASKTIVLHADELDVQCKEAKKVAYNKKSETITLTFAKPRLRGKGKISLTFTGTLNDKMRGFYRSKYFADGKEHFIATTQFEATDARRAFPCVDEPAAKAVFDVTVIVPAGHTAISNTIPISTKEHESGYEIIEFEATPKMSTYLLAFIVGKFESIEKRTTNGTLVRVFVTKGKKEQARFALDVAVKVLAFYEEYFAIKFPLPVLDMIAIPDFSAGAMENWGAIIYRETAILFDADNSSTANKQWIALVIAHELAHQWFGNLVTMEWWTHLWLNEGFASYIEYLAVNELFPDWDIWTQFVHHDLAAAMSLDALENTHPIEVEVGHPHEINEIFDAVSYSKGASIIRMLADYLGETDFRDGLRFYLKKHQYGNAATNHLWNAFEKVSRKPVARIMAGWTAKPGYPVVTTHTTGKQLRLSQSRFFSSARAKRRSKDRTVWNIPMNVKREYEKKSGRFLFNRRSASVRVSPKPSEWVSLNAGTSGMYRVEYTPQMLRQLEQAVADKKIPARDRFSLQDDAFALAEAGQMPTTLALDLAKAYRNEDDYTVWASLSSNLMAVGNIIYEKDHPLYDRYLREIFGTVAKKVGWSARKGEKHTDPMLRSLALYAMGHAGDLATIAKARELFEKMKKGKSALSPDLRGVVYGLVAKNGGAKEFAWFMKRHETEKLQEEKNRLLYSLSRFKDPKLVQKALEYSLGKHVRPQDTAGVFAYAWGNRYGTDTAWKFTTLHWKELHKRYEQGAKMMTRFVSPAGIFASTDKAREVQAFFKTHKAQGAERTVKQVIEKIYGNADWRARDADRIGKWLKREVL